MTALAALLGGIDSAALVSLFAVSVAIAVLGLLAGPGDLGPRLEDA